jgi:exodeoxyribonuclease-1
MDSFLFYDLETTGLNKSFDQVLQFAAIRTDTSLQEKERYSCLIRLRPDVVPSPEAMVTHQIPLNDILSREKTRNEFEAMQDIHALLNRPGTISLGYNTLRFDDEFLRFSFYRNLLPPYTHQYASGCGRMDLLPMTIVYRLFKPEILHWPKINGQNTLKLEHINAANRFVDGPSHDAMQDVLATLELARKFFKERAIWEYLLAYFNKKTDRKRIQNQCPEIFCSSLGSHRLGLLMGNEYGADQNYLVPVLSIGPSIPYSNQRLWLRLDLPELARTTTGTMDTDTWVIRKRYGEPPFILPPRPEYWKKLDHKRQTCCTENLQWLQDHAALFEQMVLYHREFRYPEVPDVDADSKLYLNGFLSSRDQALCQRFHTASMTGKIKMIDDFSDSVTCELAARIIFRNFLQENSEAICGLRSLKKRYDVFVARLLQDDQETSVCDYKGDKRLFVSTALKKIQQLEKQDEWTDHQRDILQKLKVYLKDTYAKQWEVVC